MTTVGWRSAGLVVVEIVGILCAVGFLLAGNTCATWGGAIYLVLMSPLLLVTLFAMVPKRIVVGEPDASTSEIRWSRPVAGLLGATWVGAYVIFVVAGPYMMFRVPGCDPGVRGLVVLEAFLAFAFIGLLTTTPRVLRLVRGKLRRPGLQFGADGLTVNGFFRDIDLTWKQVKSVETGRASARSMYGGFRVRGPEHVAIHRGRDQMPLLVTAWPFRSSADSLLEAIGEQRERWSSRGGKSSR